MEKAIEVQGLRKSYGQIEAVRGIDFYVEKGKFFAFLGPNGAGKTTTIGILSPPSKRTGAVLESTAMNWVGRMVKSAPPSALSFRVTTLTIF